MPAGKARASLVARVTGARILREHHVWEAVRILPDFTELSTDLKHSGVFRVLMDDNALKDALLVLAQTCQPPLSFDILGQLRGQWVCSVRIEATSKDARHKCFRTAHADPAAAILLAILRSVETSAVIAKHDGSSATGVPDNTAQ